MSIIEGRSHIKSMSWSLYAIGRVSASEVKIVKIWDPTTGDCVSTLETGRFLYDFQFHQANSDLLHTELGTLDLQTVATSSDFGSTSTYSLSRIAIGYGLSSNGTWITYEEENLLWLPPDYRPSSSAFLFIAYCHDLTRCKTRLGRAGTPLQPVAVRVHSLMQDRQRR